MDKTLKGLFHINVFRVEGTKTSLLRGVNKVTTILVILNAVTLTDNEAKQVFPARIGILVIKADNQLLL